MNPDKHISQIPQLRKGDMERVEMNNPSKPRPEAMVSTEVIARTVLIHHRRDPDQVVGAGCVIDSGHILTCRHPPHPGAIWVAHRYEYRNGVHVYICGGWRF